MLRRFTVIIIVLTCVLLEAVSAEEVEGEPRQAQHVYDEILADLRGFVASPEYKVIDEAAPLIGDSNRPVTRRYHTIKVPESIARPLASVYNSAKMGMFHQRRKFDQLYDEYVKKPCERVRLLKSRLDRCLKEYPEIDDNEHRYDNLPLFFSNVVKLCQMQGGNKSRDNTFNQFRKFKRG